jgi:hypothetical protein
MARELLFQVYFVVEVLGRYSNLCDQGERIQDLLRIVPEGSPEVNLRTPKQVQHRLSPNEIDNLVRLYRTGARVDELAAHFYIHRNTVSEILNRQGVPRRRQGIPSELLSEVVSAYVAGSSLAVLGSQLSVDPATVSRTLRHAGVSLRPRPGWHYAAESVTKPA